MQPSVAITHLSKSFDQLKAVDDISFEVNQGEVLGFLGPNGAGKSTTMKMLTGFLQANSGTVAIQGHDISQEPLKAQSKIGYLPEGAPCYPDMTPLQFLKFIAEIRGLKGKAREENLARVIDVVNLSTVLHQPIETLSKGFKRRVGLAQAIIHDPEVLILDEPTDGLDPIQKHEVRNLIRTMAKDKAIILSTHILEEVESVCTRAIIIAAGKIVANAAPQILAAKASSHNTVTLGITTNAAESAHSALKQIPSLEKLEILKQDENSIHFKLTPQADQNILLDVSKLTNEQNWLVEELHVSQGRLDEFFRDVTSNLQARN